MNDIRFNPNGRQIRRAYDFSTKKFARRNCYVLCVVCASTSNAKPERRVCPTTGCLDTYENPRFSFRFFIISPIFLGQNYISIPYVGNEVIASPKTSPCFETSQYVRRPLLSLFIDVKISPRPHIHTRTCQSSENRLTRISIFFFVGP